MALLAGQLGTLLAGKKADMVCMVKESTIVLTAPPALVSPSGSGEANGNVGDNELADCGDEEVAIELTSDKRDKEPP